MEQVACFAALLNVLFGFISPKEAYDSIQWDLVILLGASLGLGKVYLFC
jgi:di/tricarboxylate transporter